MTVRYLVGGGVQGVGFRWFVVRRARQLRLTGYVRNLPDGRVEVVASGPPACQAELHALLLRGPEMARVETVDKAEISDEVHHYNSFDIR
ncbi:MAG: acylphosphatase [Gemmatimonadales bacterium]